MPIRLLHCIEGMDPAFGGTVRATVELARALPVASEIVTLDAPGGDWEQGLTDTPVHALGPPRGFYRYSPRLVPWLDANLPRFDAVLIHGLWRHHNTGAWWALRRHRKPYYLMAHSMLNPWFNRDDRMKHLRKILFWRAVEHRTLRDARAVLYCTAAERDLARLSFRPYRCREVIVPLGLDDPLTAGPPRPDQFYERFPELRGRRLILFLGRLHPMKACDLLIEAFAGLDDKQAHLVMAGTDNLGWRADLEGLSRRLGVADRVTFTGPLFGAGKWSAYAAADLFALPSHCESFAYAAVEALAAGLPVLISDQVNTHAEMHATGGAIVVQDNEASIRSGLRQWLALPAESRRRMGAAARTGFLERFRIQRSVDALRALFRADLGWEI